MESRKYLNKLILSVKFMDSLDFFSGISHLTQTEFRLLREIVLEREAGKQIISSELARRLGITRSAVSQLVVKLEARGVVRRVPSPTDRKIFYVELSDHSLGVFKRQCEQANALIEEVVEEYGRENTDNLIAACEKFASVFESVQKKNAEKNKSAR